MKKVTIKAKEFSFNGNTLSISLGSLTKSIKVVNAYLNIKLVHLSLPQKFEVDFKPNNLEGWNVDVIQNSNSINTLKVNLSDEVQYCLDNNYSNLKLLFKSLTSQHINLAESDFSIEYLSNLEYQSNGGSHSIDLGKAGVASIDLSTQEVSLNVPLISQDNNVLPFSISAYYNASSDEHYKNVGLPNNWRLNVYQFLVKENVDDRLRFKYIDSSGKTQIIEEKYYYEDESGKHFIDYKNLSVDLDGNLVYGEIEVHTKLESPMGLTLVSSIKDIKNSHFVDYEPEELSSVRKQIKQLEDGKKELETGLSSNNKQLGILVLSKETLIRQLTSQTSQLSANKQYLDLQKQIEYIHYESSKINRNYNHTFDGNKEFAKRYLKINSNNSACSKPFSKSMLNQLENYFKNGVSIVNDSNETLTNYDVAVVGTILASEASGLYNLGLDNFSGLLNIQEESNELTEAIYSAQISKEQFKQYINNAFSAYVNYCLQDLSEEEKTAKLQSIKLSDEALNNLYNSFKVNSSLTLSSKDLLLIDLQIDNAIETKIKYEEKLNEYNDELTKYYHQRDLLEMQVPVHYLYSEDNVIYGFGKASKNNDDEYRLIMLADAYENTMFVKYKDFDSNQIESIIDSANKLITFNYSQDGVNLESIVDSRDRKITFTHPNENLFQITHLNGSKSNYFLSETRQTIVDESGFGVSINKTINANETNNVVELCIENFSVMSKIENGEIKYVDSLTFGDLENESIILAKKQPTSENIYIRKNNIRSTTISSKGKSITYLFDNYGKVRTIYENNFKPNSEDNCSTATEFNYKNNLRSAKITQLPYSENLLSDVCFCEAQTTKHALYLGSAYCSSNSVSYDYQICDTFHTIDANASTKYDEVLMSDNMKAKLNDSCTHKAFMLSGWAKADSAFIEDDDIVDSDTTPTYLKDRKFELRVEVTYANEAIPQVNKKSFDWRNTDWQFCSVPLYLDSSKTVSNIKCIIDYSNNTGAIEFTDLEFKEADFEESIFDDQNRVKEQSSAHSEWMAKFEYEKDTAKILKKSLIKKSELNSENPNTLDTIYEYNKQGSLIRTIDHNGTINENIYNEQGQVIKSITYHKDEPSSKFYNENCLDDKGKTTKEVDELGTDSTKLEYIDGTGLISAKTYEDGNKISYGYSSDDNLLEISSTIDGVENTNTYGYCQGTLTSLKHNDFSVGYDYNFEGNISKISVAGNKYLTKEYANTELANDADVFNSTTRTETTTLASNEKYRQTFNNDGKLLETYYTPAKTASMPNPTEKLISQNVYDILGNLVYVKEFKYNEDGSKTESVTKIFIDKFGNTYKETTNQHNKDVAINNTYDEEHSKIVSSSISINDEVISYNYNYSDDAEPKLNSITLPNGTTQTITLDKLNRIKQVTSGNISKEYNYLKYGDHSSNLVSNVKFASTAEPNENMHYSYDSKGNITEIRCNNNLVSRYAYDGLSRIVREDNKELGKTFVYSYDAGGNITARLEYAFTLISNLDKMECSSNIYSYPTSFWRDQLIRYNGETFVYDQLGNPTTYRSKTLTWSHGRQLDKFGNIAEYTYNANGIRTSKIANGFTTNYFLNGNKILKQQDALNTLTFYYGADGVTGFRLSSNVVNANYYYKKNLQGDILGIYDSNGTQIARYQYDAWGNHKVQYLDNSGNFVDLPSNFMYNNTDPLNAYIAFKNPFRYRSYYYDFETNLYYLNSRYYDPEIGRFINADDISALDVTQIILNGLNLYAYCLNNPVNESDTVGLWCLFDDLIAAMVGIFIGVIGQFVSDLTTSLFTGKWQFSSWEIYLGAAIGGLVGGWSSLYVGPIVGTAIGAGISTFVGQGLSSLTGTKTRTIEDILINSLFSAGIGAVTAGFTQYVRIQGITSGSHSFSQVFKSGLTKFVKYGFNISTKTMLKGFVSELVKSFSIGWLLNSIVNGGLEALKFNLKQKN